MQMVKKKKTMITDYPLILRNLDTFQKLCRSVKLGVRDGTTWYEIEGMLNF
jgi:hypothetical protein